MMLELESAHPRTWVFPEGYLPNRYCPDPTPRLRRTAVTFASVCKTWRVVAFDIRGLWTDVHVDLSDVTWFNDSDRAIGLEFFLERSKRWTFSLRITSQTNIRPVHASLLKVIVPHVARCKSIVLHLPALSPDDLLVRSRLLSLLGPNLQFMSCYVPIWPTGTLQNAVALESFSAVYSWALPPWQATLKHVQLYRPAAKHVRRLLHSAPLLEELVLHVNDREPDRDTHTIPAVAGSLKRLRVCSYEKAFNIVTILRDVSFPVLERLHLHGLRAIQHYFLNESAPHFGRLHDLTLDGSGVVRAERFPRAIRRVPLLRTLCLKSDMTKRDIQVLHELFSVSKTHPALLSLQIYSRHEIVPEELRLVLQLIEALRTRKTECSATWNDHDETDLIVRIATRVQHSALIRSKAGQLLYGLSR